MKGCRCITGIIFALMVAAPVHAATSTAQVQVRVTIRPWIKLDVLAHPVSVTVTQQDIEQGYVDLVRAATVRVATNERKPVTIGAASDAVGKVLLRESGGGTYAESQVGIGNLQPGLAQVRDLDIRIVLPQGATPGTYAWDVTLRPNLN